MVTKGAASTAILPPAQSVLYGRFQHPALTKICEAITQAAGITMVVVMPETEDWKHVGVSGSGERPAFCRLIHSTTKGINSCQLCHILMAVGARRDGVHERRCHAGLATLVIPAPEPHGGELAVISSCMFTSHARGAAWRQARQCGSKLGLDLKQLRAAFDALPVVTGKKLKLTHTLLSAAGAVLIEMKARRDLEKQLSSSLTLRE